MSLKFTHVYHAFRKENKLTLNEYVICDMVYHLSVNPDAKVKGWCFMSRDTMADEIGVSKQSVINLLNKMIDHGFLEKDEVTRFVKTTKKWNEVYFSNGKESLPSDIESLPKLGKESLPKDGKESLPNSNNSLYSNKVNNIDIPKTFKNWSLEDFIKSIKDENKTSLSKDQLLKFYDYWREKDAKGKFRFQNQKTWETGLRLKTWEANDKKFNSQQTSPETSLRSKAL